MKKGNTLLIKVNTVSGTGKETGRGEKFTIEYSAAEILQMTP
jgi:hypothetical protein